MSPEDRLAHLLRALDELPRGLRRLLAVLVPLVLLGAVIVVVVLAPSPEQPAPRPPTGDRGPVRRTSEPGVSAARAPARRFLQGYLAFSYGHGRLSSIRDADPEVLGALGGAAGAAGRAQAPPADPGAAGAGVGARTGAGDGDDR